MKKLLILSGKGGTGKTTVATAMIFFLGARAVADCDVDAPNLHLVLKEQGAPARKDFYGGKKARVSALSCIACGECAAACRFGAIKIKHETAAVNEISCEGCGVCRLVCPTRSITLSDDVAGETRLFRDESVFSTAELKMGRGNSGKLVTEVKFALFAAAKDAPFAVIDGSPGIGCPVIASMSGVDLVLLVAEPSLSGMSDLKRLYKTASAIGASLAVCVNKWDVNPQKSEEIEAFCAEEGIPFVGRIPFDRAVLEIVNGALTFERASCAAKDALREVADRIRPLLKEETTKK